MATVTIRPNGDGTYDTWTLTGGTAGSAYTTIDESSTDDADYISNNDTTSPYDKQSVTLEDMPSASAISSVVLKYRARSASGTPPLVAFYRSGGADTEASNQNLTTTVTEYSWDITSLETWTDTLINALEVGWRRNTPASNTMRVTQAWVEIIYTASAPPQTIIPGGVLAPVQVGYALGVPGTATIAPGGARSSTQAGSTLAIPGAVTVIPGGVAAPAHAGYVQAAAIVSLVPGGVSAPTRAGSTLAVPGAVTVMPGGVTAPTRAGSTAAAPGTVTIAPGGVVSATRSGKVAAALSGLGIAPGGAVARAVAGLTTVVPSAVTIIPGGVWSAVQSGAVFFGAILAGRFPHSRTGSGLRANRTGGRGIFSRTGGSGSRNRTGGA